MNLRTDIALLKRGRPPAGVEALRAISAGIAPLADFINAHYFKEYIAMGGSKIKFVTGKPGSGKTHFLRLLSAAAHDLGFMTVHISAREVWLHDFKEIYAEILN